MLAPRGGERVLDKRRNDAFDGTPLGALVPAGPGARARVAIVGMQSDFCVRATARAALARGNGVVLVRGAHATYDRDEDGVVTPAAEV